MLKASFCLSRYLIRQFPPKLVPTMQTSEDGQYCETRYKAVSSSSNFIAVKGIGLVISLFTPLLLRHTQQQPSSAAGFISSLMQFIQLPPVSPCITNRIGGFCLSVTGGSQSREMWPPSLKNIRYLLNLNGNRGSLMLQTDCRKGWARQGVGLQWQSSVFLVSVGAKGVSLLPKSLVKFFIFIVLFNYIVYNIVSYQTDSCSKALSIATDQFAEKTEITLIWPFLYLKYNASIKGIIIVNYVSKRKKQHLKAFK